MDSERTGRRGGGRPGECLNGRQMQRPLVNDKLVLSSRLTATPSACHMLSHLTAPSERSRQHTTGCSRPTAAAAVSQSPLSPPGGDQSESPAPANGRRRRPARTQHMQWGETPGSEHARLGTSEKHAPRSFSPLPLVHEASHVRGRRPGFR